MGIPIHPVQNPNDLDAEIRELLTRVMRSPDCRLSRQQIADFLSRRINTDCPLGPGQPFSFYMLNAYTAKHESEHGKKLRFPAAFVPAFCEITGNFELLRLIVGPHLDKLRELDAKRKSMQRKRSAKGTKRKK